MSFEDCIDVVQEWVNEQGFLTTSLVDRGDPVTPDWSTPDFTRDGAWHDLDLSAIVPAGAKAVFFLGSFKSPLVNEFFILRKRGNANLANRSVLLSLVANINTYGDLTCPCDSDRFVQYNTPAGLFRAISLTVKGWWL